MVLSIEELQKLPEKKIKNGKIFASQICNPLKESDG